MTKRATVEIPLVKRPIAEIVSVARAAGRDAFITKSTIEAAYTQARFEWIGKAFPTGEGMPDQKFDQVLRNACDAFDKGVEDYLKDCTVLSAVKRENDDLHFEKQCAAEMFDWLRGLFDAISNAAEQVTDFRDRDKIKRLAACGSYLASDRHDLMFEPEQVDESSVIGGPRSAVIGKRTGGQHG